MSINVSLWWSSSPIFSDKFPIIDCSCVVFFLGSFVDIESLETTFERTDGLPLSTYWLPKIFWPLEVIIRQYITKINHESLCHIALIIFFIIFFLIILKYIAPYMLLITNWSHLDAIFNITILFDYFNNFIMISIKLFKFNI